MADRRDGRRHRTDRRGIRPDAFRRRRGAAREAAGRRHDPAAPRPCRHPGLWPLGRAAPRPPIRRDAARPLARRLMPEMSQDTGLDAASLEAVTLNLVLGTAPFPAALDKAFGGLIDA